MKSPAIRSSLFRTLSLIPTRKKSKVMRMWMIAPHVLCRKHLLGEHNEIHKHRHNFVKGHKMHGRLNPIVQVEPSAMESRHDELAAEMTRRGYNHKSPFTQPDLYNYSDDVKLAKVNRAISFVDLVKRCPECKKRINESDSIPS